MDKHTHCKLLHVNVKSGSDLSGLGLMTLLLLTFDTLAAESVESERRVSTVKVSANDSTPKATWDVQIQLYIIYIRYILVYYVGFQT